MWWFIAGIILFVVCKINNSGGGSPSSSRTVDLPRNTANKKPYNSIPPQQFVYHPSVPEESLKIDTDKISQDTKDINIDDVLLSNLNSMTIAPPPLKFN